MNRVGIDLGGTKIEGVLIQNDNIIERKRVLTKRDDGYKAIIGRIVSMINDLRTLSNIESSIGICTPGAISPHTGRLKNSNTVCLIGQPLKEDIERAIGSSIKMENDANCFTIAEARDGAVKGYDVVFGVILGTGVGGGIVKNGKIIRGRTNIAGEWGHSTLHPRGNDCYCGRKGCVETYISGTALEKQWLEITGESKALPDVIATAKNLDEEMKSIYIKWKEEFVVNFGIALANVINILDPDAIVLGGGLSNINWLYDEGMQDVYKNVFGNQADTPILKNKLGDSAGVIGAAYL